MVNKKLIECGAECTVLLKSKGDFPLSSFSDIALYGAGVRHTIKGGTGSGDVNIEHLVSIEEAFEEKGYSVKTKAWLDSYDTARENAKKEFQQIVGQKLMNKSADFMFLIGATIPEPEYDIPLSSECDSALYILSRNSGEGLDRTETKGDYLLTDAEIRDIKALNKLYKHFMLVLNVGGVVDLSPIVDDVDNILLLSQLGEATSYVLFNIVTGLSNPSGKLSDSWTKYSDYLNVGNFGNNDDTYYKEGIYVGYRYFLTVGKKPLFPFGYGLSFTTFGLNLLNTTVDGDEVDVSILVSNTGKRSGKEVVELYLTKPEGRLDQPTKELVAFNKTNELLPGKSEDLHLKFKLSDFASYDRENNTLLLEKGEYILSYGSDSENTTVASVLYLNHDTTFGGLTDFKGEPDFTDWRPEKRVEVKIPDGTPRYNVLIPSENYTFNMASFPSSKALEIAKKLTDDELCYLSIGGFDEKKGSGITVGNASLRVAGAAGETTNKVKDIPSLVLADGPAGVRVNRLYGEDENGIYATEEDAIITRIKDLLPPEFLPYLSSVIGKKEERKGQIKEHNASAIPIGAALSYSFNTKLVESLSDIVGSDMERIGVSLWLAPAMNIKRNPLCGRNFEYYSEDPLLSGEIASAITRGIQSHKGRGVTIKHFACNNQENGRMNNNSHISIRALRDIYLKGFERTIKNASPVALMTSYNLINGIHSSERKDLLEGILREEWGYNGLIMTDWVISNFSPKDTKWPGVLSNRVVTAGNNIMMPGSLMDFNNLKASIATTDDESHISRERLERNAAIVIDTILSLTNN